MLRPYSCASRTASRALEVEEGTPIIAKVYVGYTRGKNFARKVLHSIVQFKKRNILLRMVIHIILSIRIP
jgi:hypothetical protein